ncbi:hypothetical protein ABFA07_001431, partial [Porites harrisoni]
MAPKVVLVTGCST